MGIVKLTEAGDSLTMVVKDCEAVKGQYGDQIKFTGESGDILYLPKDSADRQLDRIPLAYADAIGEVLTFSRDPNPKKGAKPYWGIRVASAAERVPAAPSKRVKPQDADPSVGIPDHHRLHPADRVDPRPMPFDEPTDEERFREFSEAVDALDPNAQPPLTPREERDRAAESPLDALTTAYVDLYAKVFAGMLATHAAAVTLNRQASRSAEAVPALTADAIHAATATVWIEANRRGMLR